DADPTTSPTEDEFRFRVLQGQSFLITLAGADLPADARITLTDDAGNAVPIGSRPDGQTLFGALDAGTYRLKVGSWSPDQAASASSDSTGEGNAAGEVTGLGLASTAMSDLSVGAIGSSPSNSATVGASGLGLAVASPTAVARSEAHELSATGSSHAGDLLVLG